MLPKENRIPVGARLYRFRSAWMGTNVESIARVGLSWSWKTHPPKFKRVHQKRSRVIQDFVKDMLRQRVCEKAKKILHQSRLFTVPKRDSDKLRIILDLSPLNKFISCPTFKMLTLKEVKLILPQNAFTTSIDLKDGYWHIPVAQSKRPYLGFSYNNVDYQFRAVPFGLNIAPRMFTKVISAILKKIAEIHVFCLAYLDDILIISPTELDAQKDTEKVLEILHKMGFLYNEQKSRLQPLKMFEWLGISWDLISFRSSLLPRTLSMCQESIKSLCLPKTTTKRSIMKAQGCLNWAAQNNPFLKPALALTINLIQEYRRHSLDKKIVLQPFKRARLMNLLPIDNLGIPLGLPQPTIVVQTDASLSGWGIVIGEDSFRGPFQVQWSINELELWVIFQALLILPLRNAMIQIHCDNQAAVMCMRKGRSKSPRIQCIISLIMRLARQKTLFIDCLYIQGAYNVLADQLSRVGPISTEWTLSQEVFNNLNAQLNCKIDLFATKWNHKLPMYASPCPDQNALFVDAFSRDWGRFKTVFLFPPTPLVSKVLAKLKSDKVETALLITREFATKPWYMSLLKTASHSFPLQTVLTQNMGDPSCTHSSHVTLHVWILSKKPMI